MVKRTKKVIDASEMTAATEISVLKSVIHDITNPSWKPTVTAENRADLMYEILSLTLKLPSSAIRKDGPFRTKLGVYIKELTQGVHFSDIMGLLHEISLKVNADRGLLLTLIDIVMEILYLIMLSTKKSKDDGIERIE